MSAWSRRLLPLVVAAICAVTAAPAVGHAHRGPLTGRWTGYIAGEPGSGLARHHIAIVVNANESGGTWRLSGTCYGRLALDTISNGYHHYLRKRGRGSSCAGGDIDCLKRVGANVYDAVTSRAGGAYDSSGTLRRVRAR